MKFKIAKNQFKKNLPDALRSAGYFSIIDQRSNQSSFVRRLSNSQHYPRFHLYIDEDNDSYQFNLHLDQKKVSYHGQKAHSGEYDEPLVKEEAERINSII